MSVLSTLYPNNPGMRAAFQQLDKEVAAEDKADLEQTKTLRTLKVTTDTAVRIVYGMFGACVLATLLLPQRGASPSQRGARPLEAQ
jgi:hypothetical protein